MPVNTSADSMSQLREIVTQATAREIRREAKNNAAIGAANTNDGDAPAETPAQETQHGTN